MKLLRDEKIDFQIIDYLKKTLKYTELLEISRYLGLHPKDFIRKRETDFKEQKLEEKLDDKEALLKAMEKYPKIIERPIIVSGEKAVIGRPPEKAIELIKRKPGFK